MLAVWDAHRAVDLLLSVFPPGLPPREKDKFDTRVVSYLKFEPTKDYYIERYVGAWREMMWPTANEFAWMMVKIAEHRNDDPESQLLTRIYDTLKRVYEEVFDSFRHDDRRLPPLYNDCVEWLTAEVYELKGLLPPIEARDDTWDEETLQAARDAIDMIKCIFVPGLSAIRKDEPVDDALVFDTFDPENDDDLMDYADNWTANRYPRKEPFEKVMETLDEHASMHTGLALLRRCSDVMHTIYKEVFNCYEDYFFEMMRTACICHLTDINILKELESMYEIALNSKA